MRLQRLLLSAIAAAILAPISQSFAVDTAIVKADHVAVRAEPSSKSERLKGNLKKGDLVRVISEVEDRKATGSEPRHWAQIEMPAKFPVWVASELVDAKTLVVKSDLANLRTGPGKNFSRVGQLPKGSKVTQVRTQEGWTQIDPPPSAVAYIASDLIGKEGKATTVAKANPPARQTSAAPAPTPLSDRPQPKWITSTAPGRPLEQPVRQAQPAIAPPPPVQAPVQTVADSTPAPVAPPESAPAQPVYSTPAPVAPRTIITYTTQSTTNWVETKRKVTREGFLVPSANPKAPSGYCLLSKSRSEGLMNYVYTTDPKINLKQFLNMAVTVVGEEVIDPKFKATPVLLAESVSLE